MSRTPSKAKQVTLVRLIGVVACAAAFVATKGVVRHHFAVVVHHCSVAFMLSRRTQPLRIRLASD
jgi:hypothetical protein